MYASECLRPLPYRAVLSWHGLNSNRAEGTAASAHSRCLPCVFLSGCSLGARSVYFQRGRLIRASSCQRFVSAPLLSQSRPSPKGVGGIRQMNTFKSNSTQADNSLTAMPPAPLGRDMVVLCLISQTLGVRYRGSMAKTVNVEARGALIAHWRPHALCDHVKVKVKPYMQCTLYNRGKVQLGGFSRFKIIFIVGLSID